MAKKMAVRSSSQPESPPLNESHIHVGSQLGIEDAAALHQQLCAAVSEPRPVVLEGAEVSTIHTAALELFCLFCRDRRRVGRETRWFEPSETLRAAAALLGLSNLMALDTVSTAP